MYFETYNDPILQEDIEYLVMQFDYIKLYNKKVLITGATGLIGSQLVKFLLCLNRIKNANIAIHALIRDKNKAKRVFSHLCRNENIHFHSNDIKENIYISDSIDYIIHGASVTSSQTFIEKPVETIDTAYVGIRILLDFARLKNVKDFIYLSSMEVFGITDPRLEEIAENDYGYIDILNPRSRYFESKRLCECLCACYANEYKLPDMIARLVQVVGAGIEYNDSRVAAQFARSIIENKILY